MNTKINLPSTSRQPFTHLSKGHQIDPIFGNIWIKDTEGMIDGQKGLAGRFCDKMWNWFEIDMWGKCWMCCPSWLPYSIGNLRDESIKTMWNGPKAQAIRQQVFDGTWQYCQHNFCPLIADDRLPSLADQDKELSIVADELPTHIIFSNNRKSFP